MQRIHAFTHQSRPGTTGYIPPEAMRRESNVEVSSAEFKQGDVYSFGVLMCYILSGTNPFFGKSEAQITVMIVVDNERPVIPSHVDSDPLNPVFKRMIQQFWHHDPDRRGDFDTILAQLSVHVVDPKLEKNTSSMFLRILPPLRAGVKSMHLLGWDSLCADSDVKF